MPAALLRRALLSPGRASERSDFLAPLSREALELARSLGGQRRTVPLNFETFLAAGAAAEPPTDLCRRYLAVPQLHESVQIEPISAPAVASSMESQTVLEVLAHGVYDDHPHGRRS